MDFGKAFAFVFEDDQWITKVLLAAAILLLGVAFSWVLAIPLILAALLLGGYSVEVTRRVIQGDPDALPDWDDWGQLFADGLKVWVIGIVYALPIIVVSLCLSIPTGMLAENAEGASGFFGFLLGCFNFLWAIVLSIVMPAAVGHFVAKDDMGAAFRFGEVFALVRDNLSTYLLTFLMTWVAQIIGGLGSLVCGVGVLVTYPYSIMVIGNLYGQAYLEATGQTAPAVVDVVDVESE
ncbi:MAG: DUF4013 domain-containing protein [Anaerolineae bacterium]|jgi:hypothetical protein